MTDPVFGITIRRDANEAAVPSNALMSVVGICMPFAKAATASQEDFDAAFPQGVAVRMNSNDTTFTKELYGTGIGHFTQVRFFEYRLEESI